MKLIALQQPMAVDLRTIGTCMKIITDFDRISDLAGDIAEIVVQIADEPHVKPLIDIYRGCWRFRKACFLTVLRCFRLEI